MRGLSHFRTDVGGGGIVFPLQDRIHLPHHLPAVTVRAQAEVLIARPVLAQLLHVDRVRIEVLILTLDANFGRYSVEKEEEKEENIESVKQKRNEHQVQSKRKARQKTNSSNGTNMVAAERSPMLWG